MSSQKRRASDNYSSGNAKRRRFLKQDPGQVYYLVAAHGSYLPADIGNASKVITVPKNVRVMTLAKLGCVLYVTPSMDRRIFKGLCKAPGSMFRPGVCRQALVEETLNHAEIEESLQNVKIHKPGMKIQNITFEFDRVKYNQPSKNSLNAPFNDFSGIFRFVYKEREEFEPQTLARVLDGKLEGVDVRVFDESRFMQVNGKPTSMDFEQLLGLIVQHEEHMAKVKSVPIPGINIIIRACRSIYGENNIPADERAALREVLKQTERNIINKPDIERLINRNGDVIMQN